MDPSSRPIPAQAGHPSIARTGRVEIPGESRIEIPRESRIEIIVADPAWRAWLRDPERLARRAAHAVGGDATIVLDGDAAVKRLNARHRGRNKPTNVLTFEPAARFLPGEIVLALGTVRREAEAAGRRGADHLAHLVVHGMLHLQGHDHHEAGPARRMELAEARLLGRMRRPNPWKPGAAAAGKPRP
jgi:probable rRNA maturation factor